MFVDKDNDAHEDGFESPIFWCQYFHLNLAAGMCFHLDSSIIKDQLRFSIPLNFIHGEWFEFFVLSV